MTPPATTIKPLSLDALRYLLIGRTGWGSTAAFIAMMKADTAKRRQLGPRPREVRLTGEQCVNCGATRR